MVKPENVKAGDRVWVQSSSFSGRKSNRLVTVTRVTPKRIRSGNEEWLRAQGKHRSQTPGSPVGFYTSGYLRRIATPDEIEKWEAAQAQKRQDKQDEQDAKTRLYQESCERARRLFQSLWEPAPVGTATGIDGNILTIDFEGHRYCVEEIETNGE